VRLVESCCQNPIVKSSCAYRPEQEGKWAPREFRLDVMALAVHGATKSIGGTPNPSTSCHHQFISAATLPTKVSSNPLSDIERINTIIGAHKQVILAIDGLQPDMGDEVLG